MEGVMKKLVVYASIIFILIALVLYKWVVETGPLMTDTTIVVTKGSTVRMVANDLKNANVINKAWLLELVARVKKIDRRLRAGEYYFPANISVADVLDKLERGDVFYRRITLPEGLTTNQYIYLISSEENLSGDITIDVGEGEMLAETYTFSKGDSRDSIIIQAKLALEKALAKAWENRGETILKDKYEALILASIIEKETAIPEERGLVASVFLNRLRIGMRLQTDPTVIYALTEGKTFFVRGLKKKDLKINSPYNTYTNKGLPPTPICNVNINSIEAALNPENTKYLYFVADGRGGHHFAESYSEHQNNISKWIKVIRPQ